MPAQPLSAASGDQRVPLLAGRGRDVHRVSRRARRDAAHGEVDDEAGIARRRPARGCCRRRGRARARPRRSAQSSAAAQRAGVVHARVEARRPADAEGGERGEGNVLARFGSHGWMLRRILDAWTTERRRSSGSPPRRRSSPRTPAARRWAGWAPWCRRRDSAPPKAATRRSCCAGPAGTFRWAGRRCGCYARVFNPIPFGVDVVDPHRRSLPGGQPRRRGRLPAGPEPRWPTTRPRSPSTSRWGSRMSAAGPGGGAGAVGIAASAYRLDGRIGVDAGPLGRPTFGPMTILEGDVSVRR